MQVNIYNNILDFEHNLEHDILRQLIDIWNQDKILTTYKKTDDDTEYLLMHIYNYVETNIYGLIKKEANDDYKISFFLNGDHWIKQNLVSWSITDMDSLYLQWLLDDKLNEIESNLNFCYIYELLNTKEYKKFNKLFLNRTKKNKSSIYQVIVGLKASEINHAAYRLFVQKFTSFFEPSFINLIESPKIKLSPNVIYENNEAKRVYFEKTNLGLETLNFNFDTFKIILQLYELETHLDITYFDKQFMILYFDEKWFNELLDSLENYQKIVYENRDSFAYFVSDTELNKLK